MYSMTGYGRAEYNQSGITLSVEIKTVNNRNFDFNCKMPRLFLSLEDCIRKIVSEYVNRARIDVFINFSDKREGASSLELDVNRAAAIFKAAKDLSENLGILNDLTTAGLLKFPDVLSESIKKDPSEFEEILKETVKSACENLNAMRKAEGEKLISDMLKRMDDIAAIREEIVLRAPAIVSDYREKLKARIEDALKDVNYDEAKLLSEVAFFTDRANIDEELTRLNSHINQFRNTVKTAGAGKKLDFLMQEFNREANTICSKSNDISITELALALKNEIEKVREQVQNVE